MFACGCGTSETKPSGGPVSPAKPEKAPQAEPAVEVTLRTVDIDDYNEEIAGHKGKVVFVDFWATWCGPCTAQFPHTVELHKKFGSKGLDVVSLTLDGETDEEAALAFLKEQNAAFTNLRSEYGAGTESVEKFNLKASVPHFRLYDRTGKLRESWDGKPEGVEAKIEELLKEPAS